MIGIMIITIVNIIIIISVMIVLVIVIIITTPISQPRFRNQDDGRAFLLRDLSLLMQRCKSSYQVAVIDPSWEPQGLHPWALLDWLFTSLVMWLLKGHPRMQDTLVNSSVIKSAENFPSFLGVDTLECTSDWARAWLGATLALGM